MRQNLLSHFLLLNLLLFSLPGFSAEDVWLLVDTKKLTLEVKQNNKTLLLLKNIAIGQNGAGLKKRIGDDVTPLGEYKISWVNHKSRYKTFYGFNYPSVNNAHEALLRGLISKRSHSAIIKAHNNNKVPPQNTKIGGQLGIHGLGEADVAIHKLMNWTQGCIAINNEQLKQLAPWIGKGTRVKVK